MRMTTCLAAIVPLALFSSFGFAQAGPPITMTWYTIDGGGSDDRASSSAAFDLEGSIGQYDAFSDNPMRAVTPGGVAIELRGGYWPGLSPRCHGDWNRDRFGNSQDYFDFLNDFFRGEADFNFDGFTNSQDFFDYLSEFFMPC